MRDKDNLREYGKKYYEKNRDRVLNRCKKYREENKENEYKRHKRYNQTERGRASIKRRQEKYQKSEKRKIWLNKWRQSEKGKISLKKANKKWRRSEHGKTVLERINIRYNKSEKGKERYDRSKNKRRYILLNTVSTLTLEEWNDILLKYNNRCVYCHVEFTDIIRPTKDHVIPLIRGGHHIKENIVPACKSCNSKKGDKLILNSNLSVHHLSAHIQ